MAFLKFERKSLKIGNNILKCFTFFMVLVYLALGFGLVFTRLFHERIPDFQKKAFGIFLLAYGCFRAYRLINSFKKDENDDEN